MPSKRIEVLSLARDSRLGCDIPAEPETTPPEKMEGRVGELTGA